VKDGKQGKAANTKDAKDAVNDVKRDQKDGEPNAKKVGFPVDFNDDVMAELMSENDENDLNKLPKLI